MTKLKKKILAGILSGAILMTGGLFANTAYAADTPQSESMELARQRERPQLTADQITKYAKELADYYGVNQSQVEAALKAQVPYGDIQQAAMLAKLSGKPFSDVLAMKCDWWQVAEKLGVSREKIDAYFRDEMLNGLARESKLDKKTVDELLKDRYDPRDICAAGWIANASGKSAKSVLAKRRINNNWEDVAKEFGVDFRKLMEQNRPANRQRQNN